MLEREQPVGVVHPVRRADAAQAGAGDLGGRAFRILGTPYEAIDLAEDRARFGAARSTQVGVRCPDWGIARADEARAIAARIGYPVLVRPSYVLGGRAMRVCYTAERSRRRSRGVAGRTLVDRFLENAIELDVDALCDGAETLRRRGDGARRGGRRSTRATRRAYCPRRRSPTTSA